MKNKAIKHVLALLLMTSMLLTQMSVMAFTAEPTTGGNGNAENGPIATQGVTGVNAEINAFAVDSYDITGTITLDGTATAVPNVKVQLLDVSISAYSSFYDSEYTVLMEATSDSSGGYSLAGVANGDYTIRINDSIIASDFIEKFVRGMTVNGATVSYDIQVTGYSLANYTCSGTLKDGETGTPIPNVLITLTLGSKSFTATSGSDGKYSFSIGSDVSLEQKVYIPRGSYSGIAYQELNLSGLPILDLTSNPYTSFDLTLWPVKSYKIFEDDFMFDNSHASFGYSEGYRIPLERYAQLYRYSDAKYLYDNLGPWGGSCYGFSVSNLALYGENLNKTNYQFGADYIYSIAAPRSPSSPLTQLLELFQITQFASDIYDQMHENNKNQAKKLVDATQKFQAGDSSAGVVLGVMSPRHGGHAIVPYAVKSLGNNNYELSIYDNNWPDDENRKMTVNTATKQWSYTLWSGLTFGSSSGDYFGFISYKEVFDLVDRITGISSRSGAASTMSVSGDGMSAFIPSGSTLKDESGSEQSSNVLMGLINGQTSQRANRMFTLDSGTYSVTAGGSGNVRGARSAGGTGNMATFLSNGSFVSVQTDDPNSTIYGGSGGNVSINSAGTNNFTITYDGSNTSNNPVTLSGSANGILSATARGNTLQITASGGATFTSTQGGSYILAAGQTASIVLNPVSQSTSSNSSSTKFDPVKSESQMKWLEKSYAQFLAKEVNTKSGSVVTTKYSGPYGARKAALEAFAGLSYRHDTVIDGIIEVRITLSRPELAKQDLQLAGRVKGGDADKLRMFFEKWFKNKIRVIHFDQQDAWGQPVNISVNANFTDIDTANLYFYNYDKTSKVYKRIGNPNYWIDKNGYLHFNTESAGNIVISEGPLERK